MAYRKKTASKPVRRRTSVRRAKSYRKPRESINVLQDIFLAGLIAEPAIGAQPNEATPDMNMINSYLNNPWYLKQTIPENAQNFMSSYANGAKVNWKAELMLGAGAVASHYIGNSAFGRKLKIKAGKRNLKLF